MSDTTALALLFGLAVVSAFAIGWFARAACDERFGGHSK